MNKWHILLGIEIGCVFVYWLWIWRREKILDWIFEPKLNPSPKLETEKVWKWWERTISEASVKEEPKSWLSPNEIRAEEQKIEEERKSWAYDREEPRTRAQKVYESEQQRIQEWLAGPKYCEKHKVTYDVGNCLQCDIEKGTGLIGQYAQQIQNPDRSLKAPDLKKDDAIKEGDYTAVEIRSGYQGAVRGTKGQMIDRGMVTFFGLRTSSIQDNRPMSYVLEGSNDEYFKSSWPIDPNTGMANSVPESIPVIESEPEDLFPSKRKFRDIA